MAGRRKVTRGNRNIEWIEAHCRVPEGKFVGKPVKLSPEQKKWVRRIYDTPTRMFILSMARKNAKTATICFLLLLHTCGPEAVPNSQLYSTALSRDQAAVIFDLASKVIRMSPDLSQYVTIRDTAKEFVCQELGTVFKALSADATTAHGKSPIFAVHDELGQVRGPRSLLFDAIETGMSAHDRPLSVVISTQAPTDGDLLSILIDDAKRGDDPTIKVELYTADETLDPFSEKAIRQANPHFDFFMNKDEVRNAAEKAKRMPSSESSYRNLILNQRVNMTNPFVSRAVWDANAGEPDYSAFDGDVFVGLDLSSRHDLTAAVAVVKRGGKWHVWPTFFAPEDGVQDRAHRDRVPYDVWARNGQIILTPGATVDYEYVAKWLIEFCDDHGVRQIRFDRWRMDVFKAELSRLGAELPMEEFGQGYRSMTPALDTLEAELVEGNILHGGHPVLQMCAANAVAVTDPAGNRKLDKSKATGRIDGMVALAMAIGGASQAINEETPPLQMFMLG